MINLHAPAFTNTGVDATIQWCVPTGLRFHTYSPDKVINLILEADFEMSPTGQGGMAYVDYAIYLDGGLETTVRVASKANVQPNWGDYRTVNGPAGPCARHAWSTPIDLREYNDGVITVIPTAYAMSGDSTVGATLTIYNDVNGGDQRPAPVVVYVDHENGIAGGTGDILDPVDSIQEAIDRCIPNPSGSSASDRDVGGAEIVLLDDYDGDAIGTATGYDWHTSGEWRLRISGAAHSGARNTYRRVDSTLATLPDDVIVGGGEVTGDAKVELVDILIEGGGFVFEAGTNDIYVRDIGCASRSSFYSTAHGDAAHVDHWEDSFIAAVTQPVYFNGGTGTGYWESSWGHHRYAVGVGFYASCLELHDFKVENILKMGVSFSSTAPVSCVGSIRNLNMENGYPTGYGDVTGGADFTFTLTGTTVRLTDTSGGLGVNLYELFGPLASSSGFWGIAISGATSAGNNGNWAVVATGYDSNGRGYIEWTNASGVSEVGGASARCQTCQVVAGTNYSTTVGITVGHYLSAGTTAARISHVRLEEIRNAYTFASAGTHSRLAFTNCNDGGSEEAGYNGTMYCWDNFTDCVWYRNSFLAETITFKAAAAGVYDDTSVVNCVWGSTPTNFFDSYVAGNHFVTGAGYGTDVTTGSFLDGPTPSTGNLGGGTALGDCGDRETLEQDDRPTISDWIG